MGKKERERAKLGKIFRDGRLLEGDEAKERLVWEDNRRKARAGSPMTPVARAANGLPPLGGKKEIRIAVIGDQTITARVAKAIEKAKEAGEVAAVVVKPEEAPDVVVAPPSFADRLRKLKEAQ